MVQLLDSVQKQQLQNLPQQLVDALDDIVTHLKIKSNFCIEHRDYKPLELAEEAVERFQKLPVDLQEKFLRLQLQNFLYGIYYNGSLRKNLAMDADDKKLEMHKDLANNTYLGIDLSFHDRLHESNMGTGNFSFGWQIIKEESDGRLVVVNNDLTLYVDRERHLPPEIQQSATVGDSISIRLPKNRVQSGFYMAIGDAGSNRPNTTEVREERTTRVYFNLSPDGAVAVMKALTEKLNAISIPFSFKTLYNPSSFERYDSAVLYFDRNDYQTVKQILQEIYRDNQPHFRADVPLFTKILAPGLSLAEEPDFNFGDKESFGTNRCQIIVNGLLEARNKGDESKEARLAAIIDGFNSLGIQLERSHLNANSEDIYTPLDI
jgi:HopA1 effector protein family